MAYTKIVFQNSPSTATPLNAENLNHMDDQIALNDQRLTEIETSYVKSFNGRTGAISPADNDYNIGQIAPLTGAQVGQVPVVVNHGTEQDPELVFEMGAGGGGGHSIIDSEGNTMPQESAMQFADSFVSDDDVNGKTIVENIKEHSTKADYDQATEDGFHVIDDGNDVPIGEIEEDYVDVVTSSDTYKTALHKLRNDTDFDKITEVSTLIIGTNVYSVTSMSSNEIDFSNVLGTVGSIGSKIRTIFFRKSDAGDCSFQMCTLTNSISRTNNENDALSDGTKITLHYGTSSGIVELNTDARHCMMSDGVTSVEGAINNTFKQYIFDNITLQTTRNYNDLPLSLTSDEISRLLFCNATVVESGVDIYQCYWKSTNNGVRVIGKAQNAGTYTIKVTLVFSA